MQKTGASGGSSPVLFRRRSLDPFPPVKTQLHTVLWSQHATGAGEAAGADSFSAPPPAPHVHMNMYILAARPPVLCKHIALFLPQSGGLHSVGRELRGGAVGSWSLR